MLPSCRSDELLMMLL